MKRLVQPGTVRKPRCRIVITDTVTTTTDPGLSDAARAAAAAKAASLPPGSSVEIRSVPTTTTKQQTASLPGVQEVEVTSNTHYQADRWSAKIALTAPGGKDLDWWGADERKGALFDVRVSLNGDEQSLIIGEADEIDVHPETGLIEIKGRDLSSRLIDNKIQESFQNKTSSEIAKTLAGRRGLTPVVTATTTKVERFYAADHDRVSHDQFSKAGTEWDLLKWLATMEGFDLYVSGRELHFEKPGGSSSSGGSSVNDSTLAAARAAAAAKAASLPPGSTVEITVIQPASGSASGSEPYAIRWDADTGKSDVRDLRLHRSLTLAKDVVVVVRSWNSGQGRAFSRSSPQGAAKQGVNNGKAQRFVYTRPNLTEDQAQKLADQLRADITKHERNISFVCPGELDLTVRDKLAVSGCGGWDQKYFISEITRRISAESGFVQNVAAKNHQTESDATSPG